MVSLERAWCRSPLMPLGENRVPLHIVDCNLASCGLIWRDCMFIVKIARVKNVKAQTGEKSRRNRLAEDNILCIIFFWLQ